MSVSSRPRIQLFIAGGTIQAGSAVKFGADSEHVVACGASTDMAIGIAQIAITAGSTAAASTVASGAQVEVAIPGGGAKGAAHGTITAGEMLCSYTDGTLQPTTGAGDRIIGIAMDGAAAGDIFNVECVAAVASGATN